MSVTILDCSPLSTELSLLSCQRVWDMTTVFAVIQEMSVTCRCCIAAMTTPWWCIHSAHDLLIVMVGLRMFAIWQKNWWILAATITIHVVPIALFVCPIPFSMLLSRFLFVPIQVFVDVITLIHAQPEPMFGCYEVTRRHLSLSATKFL